MASKLQHMSATPREFTLQYLEQITDNFSEDHIIGRGEHGVVYKGVLDNGEEIALKKLYHMPELDDTQFRNELNNLVRARHQNIIRLIGYCCNLGHKRVKHDDEYTSAVVEERFLCFEYLQGGSLDKYISDESCALDWLTCFKIIKGVCEGLNYLHNGTNDRIFHLDLKPSNILLDKNMMPKIGDFGYSRLFPSAQTYVTTEATERTWGYKPPEYINKGETTSKFDIFSLGVIIIEVMARFIGYSRRADMPFQELFDLVHINWKKKLVAMTSCDTSRQVRVCLEMALRCLEDDQMKRPAIAEIVKELNKLNTAESSFTGEVEMEDRGSEWLQAAMELPVSASLGPIGSLFRKLHSFKATKESLPAGVNEGEIQSLKKELEELCISLMDLSEANDTSFTAKYWMKEVREVCYDTENYFDKLIMQPSNGSNVRWIHKLLKRRPQIAIDFSTLVARVADARERRGRLVKWNIDNENIEQESGQASTTPAIASSSTLSLQPPVQVACVRRPELTLKLSVSAAAHMDDLVNLLAFDDQKQKRLKVVSIFGFAGVGKTTVARTLYRKFGGKFDCRAFLRMSRQPDIRRLLTSMLSQIKAPPAHAFADVQVLVANIRTHLEHKRYFVIIDELWTPSVWNTIRRAFPDGNCCSRVITITQNEDAALACCSYQSKYIFKMRSVSGYQSRELLSSGVSDSGRGSSQDFKKLSYGVITTSGGLPLASVHTGSISEPNLIREQWEQIQDSLASTLSANPTCDVMEELLNLIYNSLPRHLKTCLLYFNMYPEGYTVWKDVLVGQWISEGFIGVTRKKEGFVGAVKQQDTEEDEVEEKVRVAQGYFAELAGRGMIQAVDTDDKGEVLSCTVHHMVLDLIRCKSMEDNFITTVDKFPSTLVLPDMVRRLSVQFGDAKVANIPENMVSSKVRSLLYFGSFECAPSTGDYGSLQVLNLHIWADQDKTFDLTTISELSWLKYFKVECNTTVNLPAKVRMLQNLRTLEVDAPLSVVPSDIFDLKSLLHLCLPSQVKLPDGIVHMTSLRSLGHFSLSTNSADNVLGLGKLIKLRDLRMTCSTVKPSGLVGNMKHFGSILGEFKELKSLIMDSGSSSFSISCDSLSNASCAPALLERFEFPRTCIFPSLPKWFGDLKKLCILKVAVRETSMENIDILKGLHALTTLSICVSVAPKARIVFGQEGFTLLRSFKFTSAALCLAFTVGAMPKVERLKLRFDANKSEQRHLLHAGIDNLLALKEISAKIGIVGADETESEAALLMDIFRTHPSSPIFNVQSVDRTFDEKTTGGYEEEHQTTETQDAHVNAMLFDSPSFVAPDTSSPMQNLGEDEDKASLEATFGPESSLEATFGPESSLEATFSKLPEERLITSEISEEGFDKQRGIQEKDPWEDDNTQAGSRSTPPPGSISHLRDPELENLFAEEKGAKKVEIKLVVTTEDATVISGCPTPARLAKGGEIEIEIESERAQYVMGGNLVVGLAKASLERALTEAHWMEKEKKLRPSAQRELAYITGEFEMMHSFLSVADEERVKNNVVMTWVRQVSELAYAFEDCIETISHVDTKPSWRRHLLPSCVGMAAGTLSPDEVVAEIGQIKGMVQDVSKRNACYQLISDCGSKPAAMQQLPAAGTIGGATAFNMLMEGRATPCFRDDLTQLFAKKENELQVISLWGTGGDLGKTSIIRKSYNTQSNHDFTCRAWVRLSHPFNPHEFVRCLVAQFYINSLTEKTRAIGVEVLQKMEAAQGDLIQEFLYLVTNKRYLIVLEGLSNMADWDAIRTFLPDQKNGSWIIVSTQQLEMASLCVGNSFQLLEMKKFSAEHSVYAFFTKGSAGEIVKSEETNKVLANYEHQVINKILVSKRNAANKWTKKYPLIGRESEMNKLRQYTLEACFNAVKVIFVRGICGVGKSALVKKMFYDRILNTITFNSWVDVPYPFNLWDFCRNLLLDFYSESPQVKELVYPGTMGRKNPIQECRGLLEQHHCLVVIDNLRTTEDWNLIKAALVSQHTKSVIIVITTEASIPPHREDKDELTFVVKGLKADAALDLFKKEVHRKTDNPHFPLSNPEEDAKLRELILKCGGFPKVILAVAGLLVNNTVRLMDIVGSTNDRFMQTLQTNSSQLHSLRGLFAWMHAYFHTCLDSLKPCIFYMPLFPQNKSIRRRRLVRRWIAEGYSRDTQDKSAEQDGETFFSNLVDMNIIQQPPESATTAGVTRMAMCQVNGFFYQYIISRLMEDDLVFELEGSCTLKSPRTKRHLVIRESWDRDKIAFDSIDISQLRSLTVYGVWKSFLISKGMKLLRVLDLEDALGVKDEDLEKMVKQLPHLKFLSLRGCHDVHRLPNSLGDLRQLESLDIRHTSIVTLPANITKSKKLQYIRAGTTIPAEESSSPCFSVARLFGCCRWRHQVGVLVPYGMEKLTVLRTLGVVNVATSGAQATLEAIKQLTQLRKLGVSGINRNNIKKFYSAISDHCHLESLSVWLDKGNQVCLDGVALPLENLQSLKVYGLGDKLPEWGNGHALDKLTKLGLQMTILTQEDIKLLGNLPKLLILRICVNPLQQHELSFSVYENGLEVPSYQKVKILEISCSSSLHVTFGSEAMQYLEMIKVDCSSGSAYGFSGLDCLYELKEVLLMGTNDETLETALQRQLLNNRNKPVVKLGGAAR